MYLLDVNSSAMHIILFIYAYFCFFFFISTPAGLRIPEVYH